MRKTLTIGLVSTLLGAAGLTNAQTAKTIDLVAESGFSQNVRTEDIPQMPLQRGFLNYKIGNGSIGIKADINTINNGAKDNTTQASYSRDISKADNISAGINATNQGELDGTGKLTTDAWVSFPTGEATALVEAGRGVQKQKEINDWLYTELKGMKLGHINVTTKVFAYLNGTITDAPETDISAVISAHTERLYACYGIQKKTHYVAAGTTGSKDVGNFTKGKYDPITKNFSFKTRTDFRELDQDWYTADNFDVGSSEEVIGGFFPIHFSNKNRGQYEIIIQGTGKRRLEALETIAGTRITKNTHVFAGVASNMTTGRSTGIFGANQSFDFLGYKGYVEASFNAATQRGAAYLSLKKSFSRKN